MPAFFLALLLLLVVSGPGEAIGAPHVGPRTPTPTPPRPSPDPRAPARPGATSDQQTALAQALACPTPAACMALADQYDAIGLHQTAAALRARALAPTPAAPAVSPVTPPSSGACVPPMTGDKQLAMVPGCHYRARLQLGGIQCLGSESDVGDYLTKLGFSGVRVYARPAVLPNNWPPAERVDHSGGLGCTRWAEGQWSGAQSILTRPDEVVSMWLA